MDMPYISQALGVVHPVCIARGNNAEVWDEQGKRYIDFIGGIGVLNLGHGHPAVREAAHAQIDTLMHAAFNATPHRGYLDVAARLATFVPVSYPLATMLTNSGAEACENALKVARAATGRQAVVAFDGGFHGRTLAALNLNGKVAPYKKAMGTLPGPVYHLPYPSPDNDISAHEATRAFERLVSVELPVEDIACIIVEPVQGEGGFLPLCPVFANTLRALCDQHGIVLILDEIQSGFGRTGQRFAFSRLGIEPDLLLIGKSIAAGLPLAAVVGREALMNAVPKGGLGGTFSGNAVACAAALAVMDAMTEDQLSRWEARQSQAIRQAWQRWHDSGRYPMLGALTGVGAMRGIVFNDTESATGSEHLMALLQAARQRGLLLMPSGRRRHVLRLLAPLTIEPELMDEGLSIIEQALESLITRECHLT
ncbi:2-aminoadipate transaminase [Larsenimonas rhizosphaerae]|uniref:Aspartate aminotransferase family protein n=1 Tax=Larsenimonas rhizosphaerae TaxID=2944682 RepID=A0AA41ZI01_9GAMM|nr:aspartate aminotransferase family protein [Larsenimonas rhizosphaerae]MCX2524208.1 aspartate aminotransferase family protein [Larsenimonas rhizosphaerae]